MEETKNQTSETICCISKFCPLPPLPITHPGYVPCSNRTGTHCDMIKELEHKIAELWLNKYPLNCSKCDKVGGIKFKECDCCFDSAFETKCIDCGYENMTYIYYLGKSIKKIFNKFKNLSKEQKHKDYFKNEYIKIIEELSKDS